MPRLDLIQSLNIAIDIAQTLEYLQHHCFVQVIHCDIKPSNVLLGEDMTAYSTDFGTSRIRSERACYYKRRCIELWNYVIRDGNWKEAYRRSICRRNEHAKRGQGIELP
ncbi:hypothetical protein SUGI_0290320 [Cryptomeria japonica]|nr:hypothetical protein SUGI_0290320 [Cryptomeria japonica]